MEVVISARTSNISSIRLQRFCQNQILVKSSRGCLNQVSIQTDYSRVIAQLCKEDEERDDGERELLGKKID